MLEPQPVNVLGKKYESKERCYKGLGITKKSVQNHMKKTSCMFEEAVVYCYEKKLEKQFEFRRESKAGKNHKTGSYGKTISTTRV